MIDDHVKSRFHRKGQQLEKADADEALLMAAKNMHASSKREAIAEKKGYLLRHYILNNRDVYIPVRKTALDLLKNDTAVTHAIFI